MNYYGSRLTCQEYRLRADRICDRHRLELNKVYLIYVLIMIVIGVINSLTGTTEVLPDGTEITSTWFNGLFDFIFGGAIMMGLIEISKKAYYNLEIKNKDLLHGFKDFVKSFLVYFLVSLYTALWAILLIVPGIIKMLSYSLALYVANDNPYMSANECITKSRELMDGHKWEYFKLIFSYFGWIILSVFTFGILLIWVLPRINQATYLFYLEVSGVGTDLA